MHAIAAPDSEPRRHEQPPPTRQGDRPMAISAKDVQALRRRTGLGMMECKKALEQTDGDADAAIELLRTKLKGKMDERADREAVEGVIAVASNGGSVTVVEVNTETDFTARNEAFVDAADKIAAAALEADEGEIQPSDAITEHIDQIRITTKENASFRRGHKLVGPTVGHYVHHNKQLGVVVTADGPIDDQTLTGVCQHIAAHVPTPIAIDESGLPDDVKAKAMADAKAEAIESGKPEQIADKIAQGKYRKWVNDHTLLGQQYVRDMEGKSTVADILPKGAKILNFIRYAVGS
jgi:elongation factor Ts